MEVPDPNQVKSLIEIIKPTWSVMENQPHLLESPSLDLNILDLLGLKQTNQWSKWFSHYWNKQLRIGLVATAAAAAIVPFAARLRKNRTAYKVGSNSESEAPNELIRPVSDSVLLMSPASQEQKIQCDQEKQIQSDTIKNQRYQIETEQKRAGACEDERKVLQENQLELERQIQMNEEKRSEKEIQLQQAVEGLETKVNVLAQQNQQLEQSTQQLEEQKQQLEEQKQQLEQSTQQLEEQNQTLNQVNEDHKHNVEELEAKNRQMETNLQLQEQKLTAEFEAERTRLEQQYIEEKKQLEADNKQMKIEMKSQKDKLQNAVEAKELELFQLHSAKLQKCQEEMDGKDQAAAELRTQITQQTQQIESLTEKLKAQFMTDQGFKTQLQAINLQVASQYKQEVERLQKEYEMTLDKMRLEIERIEQEKCKKEMEKQTATILSLTTNVDQKHTLWNEQKIANDYLQADLEQVRMKEAQARNLITDLKEAEVKLKDEIQSLQSQLIIAKTATATVIRECEAKIQQLNEACAVQKSEYDQKMSKHVKDWKEYMDQVLQKQKHDANAECEQMLQQRTMQFQSQCKHQLEEKIQLINKEWSNKLNDQIMKAEAELKERDRQIAERSVDNSNAKKEPTPPNLPNVNVKPPVASGPSGTTNINTNSLVSSNLRNVSAIPANLLVQPITNPNTTSSVVLPSPPPSALPPSILPPSALPPSSYSAYMLASAVPQTSLTRSSLPTLDAAVSNTPVQSNTNPKTSQTTSRPPTKRSPANKSPSNKSSANKSPSKKSPSKKFTRQKSLSKKSTSTKSQMKKS